MPPTIDIISIGTLSRNPFWNEKAPVRTPHATTTLIRDGDRTILVDPALPPDLLRHRLDERTGLAPERIDTVFLTNFRPAHRRGLLLLDHADWLIGELERDTIVHSLNSILADGASTDADVSYEEIESELELLARFGPAPDKISDSVGLFPAYGSSPGNAALLVSAHKSVVIAGDAVISRDHLSAGRVWDRSTDTAAARESFVELCEIADILVPGHDNVVHLS